MWGEKGLWEAATSLEEACARGLMSCHGTSFAETKNGRQEKEEGDGESLAPLPFLGTPPAGGRGGVTRTVSGLPGELNPGGSVSTLEQGQEEQPRTHWSARPAGEGLGQLLPSVMPGGWQGQRPANLCHQCALCPRRVVVESRSKCPCRASGVWRWETLPETINSLHQNGGSPTFYSALGELQPTDRWEGAARSEALTKYFVALTVLSFFRWLLKMKNPSGSLFTANGI